MVSLRKLLPRFSLRTLVILPLLATCAYALARVPSTWVQDGARFGIARSSVVTFWPEGGLIMTLDADSQEVHTDDPSNADFPHFVRVYDPTKHRDREVVSLRRLVSGHAATMMKASKGSDTTSPGGRRMLKERARTRKSWDDPMVVQVVDPRNGKVLAELGNPPFFGDYLSDFGFFPDGDRILVASGDLICTVFVFRRTRPEWWWGVFYLWEFWLTAAFAGLFVWSVVRDRKGLRGKEGDAR